MAIFPFQQSPVCALVHTGLEYVNAVASCDRPGSNIGLRRHQSERRGLDVQSGTAPFSLAPYSDGMQLVSLKGVLATVWVSAVLITGLTGNLNSLSSWAVLAT